MKKGKVEKGGSVRYAEDVGSAVEWRQINLRTSYDVPTSLNQFRTTAFDGSRWIFRSCVVSSSAQKYFERFRSDCKMTMGGLHGRKMGQGTGVGVSMVPGGRVIHHQQRCRAQQRVVPTITQLS